jgi:hypothetical protein
VKTVDRLTKYIEVKRFVVAVFERSIGVANGYIGKQRKKKGSIGSDILERIAETYPDLNLIWLITGKGAMITKPPVTTKEDEKANMLVEEEQALYKKKTELADDMKEKMDDVNKKFAEMLAIEGIKKKGGRRKKS